MMSTPMTPEQAMEYFRKRVERVPRDTQSWGGFLASLFMMGREDLLKKQLKQFDPKDKQFICEILVYYAVHLMDSGRREKAEEIFKEAIKTNKDDHTAYGLLASLHMQEKRYKDAVRQLKEANKRSPDNLVIHVMLADAYNKMKKYKDAEAVARKILQKEPNSFEALEKLAESLLGQSRHYDQVEILRKMLELKPDHVMTLFTIGGALGLLGDREEVEESEKHIRRALELSPGNKQFMGMLMIILNKLGKKEEAAEIKEKMEGKKGLSQ